MSLAEDDPYEGIDRLARLARKYAKDPAVRFGYGTSLLKAGMAHDALDHLEVAERRRPDHEVREALLDTYLSLGMIVHADRLLRRSDRTLDELSDPGTELQRRHGPRWRDLPRRDLLAFERARLAVMRADRSAIRELRRLTDRHPDWTPPRTMLAIAYLTSGDFGRFYAASDAAFEADPDDAATVLNAARAAFLREGTEGAARLRDRLDGARSYLGLMPALAWRAHAAALMNDEDEVRALLDALDAARLADEDGPGVDVDDLAAALDRRVDDPKAPLAPLMDLLAGLFVARPGPDADGFSVGAARALAEAPGLLRELPLRLGYEDERFARLLADVLLADGAPPPAEGDWREILRRIVTEGPGVQDVRVGVASVMLQRGLLDASEALPFEGFAGGLAMRGFEITGER